MEIKSSFTQKTRTKEEHVSLDGPVYHIVPYVSGGLNRLYHRIKTESVPELAEYGYHTNKEGHFEPVGECLMGLRYRVKQKLDTKGHSAVLVLAEDLFDHKKLVVIKALHSHFYQHGSQESHVLRKLAVADPLNHSHTLRLLTTLTFDSHFCLVFEPLLPEPLTRIFQEFPANRVLPNLRKVGLRLLATIGFLHQQNMIHTDLKPENILLKHESDLDSVHIVDFGNTINYVHKEVSLYYNDFELQTPLYRAPEVIFGLPFGTEIDMWSLGCILAELYTGEALFFGINKEKILQQITKLLGPCPAGIFKRGKFFEELKQYTSAEDIPLQATSILMDHLECRDVAFAELLAGLLRYNPAERLTAREAACHPFFASYFPVGFLLGDSSTGTSCYSTKHISPKSYKYLPQVSSGIKKKQPSSLDLLKMGTTECSPSKTNTNIARPKPIELLNERRKLLVKKSGKETIGAVINNKYVDALMKAKDEVKLSDNVREKMSSLLKAIKEEQNLVETDMEQKLLESAAKKSFRQASSSNKHHGVRDNDRKWNIDVEKDNKIRSPKYDKQRNILRQESVTWDSDKNIIHVHQEHEHRKTNESKKSDAIDGESDPDKLLPGSPEMNSNSLIAKVATVLGEGETQGIKEKQTVDQDQFEVVVSDTKSADKKQSRSTSKHDVSAAFEQMYSDAVTPKHTVSSDEEEYVDIISPLGTLSGAKRKQRSLHRKRLTDSSRKQSSPSHNPVRPKAIVKPDRLIQSSESQNNDMESFKGLETDETSYNKQFFGMKNETEWTSVVLNEAEQTSSVLYEDMLCDSEDMLSVSENDLEGSHETVAEVSNNLARRKSYEKANDKIKNMKNDEVKLKGCSLYVKKRKVSSEHEKLKVGSSRVTGKNFRSNTSHIDSNDSSNHNGQTFHSSGSKNSRKDESCQSVVSLSPSLQEHAAFHAKSRDQMHTSQNDDADVSSSTKQRKYSQPALGKSESKFTPIPKGINPLLVNVTESPEIIYKPKTSFCEQSKSLDCQPSERQHRRSDNYKTLITLEKTKKIMEQKRLRECTGKAEIPSSSGDIVNMEGQNENSLKTSCKVASFAEESNNSRSVNKNDTSLNCDDPFEFSGTPAADIKKMRAEGIGERIEEKRNKVKKKARKSLVFRQKSDQNECNDSDSSYQPEAINSDEEDMKSDYPFFEEKSKNYSRKELNSNTKCHFIQKNTVEPERNRIASQNRKRSIPIELRGPNAECIETRKKQKCGVLGHLGHVGFKKIGNSSRLGNVFDTTYTIETDKPKIL